MTFTSLSFLSLIAVAVVVYYRIPRRFQWYVLLAASLVFYCVGGIKPLLYVLYTTLTVYGAGLWIGRLNAQKHTLSKEAYRAVSGTLKRKRQWIVAAVCILNFGLLYVLKYWNFTADLLIGTGKAQIDLVMPLGLSFFMFQSVGYVVDVYRNKVEPEKNPLKMLLFVCFFPQMVQGPISRFDRLQPQLTGERTLCWDNLRDGIQLALWGYFKKLVIADRAAVLVSQVVDTPWSWGGAIQAVGILFYCIQLYCDFSGGIDIIRGVAQLFGIHMAENFRRPLFAGTLTEFWRRWHITLGAWLRDYLFYPLSLSKGFGKLGRFARRHIKGRAGKILPTALATFIIYFVIGIWHGANFRYLAYGFWNGALITGAQLLAGTFERWKKALHIPEKARWWKLLGILRTNAIVFFGRYITRAPRLLTALWMMKELFCHPRLGQLTDGTLANLGLSIWDWAIIGGGLLTVLIVETWQERGMVKNGRDGSVREWLAGQCFAVQLLEIVAAVAVLYCFGILRAEYITSDFIYQQY